MSATFRALLLEMDNEKYISGIESLAEGVPDRFWGSPRDPSDSAHFVRKFVDISINSGLSTKASIQGFKNILSSEGPFIREAGWTVACYELLDEIKDIAQRAGSTFEVSQDDYALHEYTVTAHLSRGAWSSLNTLESSERAAGIVKNGNAHQLASIASYLMSAIKGSYTLNGESRELKVEGIEKIEDAIHSKMRGQYSSLLDIISDEIREKKRLSSKSQRYLPDSSPTV